jgi:hypothetical protein
MQMRKNCTFKHFAKSKKLGIFLPISIILRLIPIKFETLKPPSVHLPPLPARLILPS